MIKCEDCNWAVKESIGKYYNYCPMCGIEINE